MECHHGERPGAFTAPLRVGDRPDTYAAAPAGQPDRAGSAGRGTKGGADAVPHWPAAGRADREGSRSSADPSDPAASGRADGAPAPGGTSSGAARGYRNCTGGAWAGATHRPDWTGIGGWETLGPAAPITTQGAGATSLQEPRAAG